VVDKITRVFPAAAIIPMRFGTSPDAGYTGIRTWQEKLAADDLL
jgi:hypothetical protein